MKQEKGWDAKEKWQGEEETKRLFKLNYWQQGQLLKMKMKWLSKIDCYRFYKPFEDFGLYPKAIQSHLRVLSYTLTWSDLHVKFIFLPATKNTWKANSSGWEKNK